MSNNEKLLIDEIKELKYIISNYQSRDIEILNLYKQHNSELYSIINNDEKLDNDIIINKFKNVLEREKDLHRILRLKYLKVEKCNNCSKLFVSGKGTFCRYNKDYNFIYFCSKDCSDTSRENNGYIYTN